MALTLRRKTVATPSIQERTLQANALTTGALSIFEQAANDLEIASALKEEIATELDARAADLRAEADEIDAQVFALDAAAETDLDAAERIRQLFAA